MKILTIFMNSGVSHVHLWKDVGGIPYALAKYCGWEATFAYCGSNSSISDEEYEKYVQLDCIKMPFFCGMFATLIMMLSTCLYVWRHVVEYDVINVYHYRKFTSLLCTLAKFRKPAIKTYVKLDMARKQFDSLIKNNSSYWDCFWKNIDMFSVETKLYQKKLSDIDVFDGRLEYIPNGFFGEFLKSKDDIEKENIVCTVGRIGIYEKNNEMLVNALASLDKKRVNGWKVFIIGPCEQAFKKWFETKIIEKPFLEEVIFLVGNIEDKGKLAEYYQRSKVFVLTSRVESFGLVIPEAMSFGNYVILTNCCDAFSDIVNEKGEKLFHEIDKDDVEQLANLLGDIFSGEVELENMATQAKLHSKKHMDWKYIIKKLDVLLKR